MVGIRFGGIVAGALRKVFDISGIIIYIVEKEFVPDTPAVVASVVYCSVAISLANLLVDILYTFVTPESDASERLMGKGNVMKLTEYQQK